MRDRCFENREDIENVLDKLNNDWSRTRVDNPNRVREMLARGGMLWSDAEILDQLMAPETSMLDWGTAVNFTAGSESVDSVQPWPLPYGFVDMRPSLINPGQEAPLRFRKDMRVYQRWMEPIFGFQDYMSITSMVRAVQSGGSLSVKEDEVDEWLEAHHKTALYDKYTRRQSSN